MTPLKQSQFWLMHQCIVECGGVIHISVPAERCKHFAANRLRQLAKDQPP